MSDDEIVEQDLVGDGKKKEKFDFVPLIVLGCLLFLCLLFFGGFWIGSEYGREKAMDSNGFFVSNLTNSSLELGFMSGYNVCMSGVLSAVNNSILTCNPVVVNASDVLSYLLPYNCLNTTG